MELANYIPYVVYIRLGTVKNQSLNEIAARQHVYTRIPSSHTSPTNQYRTWKLKVKQDFCRERELDVWQCQRSGKPRWHL